MNLKWNISNDFILPAASAKLFSIPSTSTGPQIVHLKALRDLTCCKVAKILFSLRLVRQLSSLRCRVPPNWKLSYSPLQTVDIPQADSRLEGL
jgi:hypothetical protein